jgi:endo-alpha-1,4-polygalactosaminidase (GH114 family)
MNLLPDVAAHYDFAINEQCHIYKECALYRDFTKLGKPVFNIEYAAAYKRNTKNAFTKACAESRSLGINTFVYPQALDGSFIKYCK